MSSTHSHAKGTFPDDWRVMEKGCGQVKITKFCATKVFVMSEGESCKNGGAGPEANWKIHKGFKP